MSIMEFHPSHLIYKIIPRYALTAGFPEHYNRNGGKLL